jgi:hypothetical protein
VSRGARNFGQCPKSSFTHYLAMHYGPCAEWIRAIGTQLWWFDFSPKYTLVKSCYAIYLYEWSTIQWRCSKVSLRKCVNRISFKKNSRFWFVPKCPPGWTLINAIRMDIFILKMQFGTTVLKCPKLRTVSKVCIYAPSCDAIWSLSQMKLCHSDAAMVVWFFSKK